MKTRLGIFGGSFDPVHFGHLLLAESCRVQAGLDRVVFVPNAVSPHKIGSEPVSAENRVEMLKLAIGGHAPFEVSQTEIERGGISYTVDTLQRFRDSHTDAELFFLMGADSLNDFPQWKDPDIICKCCTLLVVCRPGLPAPDFSVLDKFASATQIETTRSRAIMMPQIDISSTEIRHRARDNQSFRFQTPRAVEKYIQTKGLYQQPNQPRPAPV